MRFLFAGGHRLEYHFLGPRGSPESAAAGQPTLVLLHEGLGSVAMWKNFPADIVAATGSPVLVYSRYGYGKSDKLAEARKVDYMHREALEVLPEVLDQLGIDAPILIGHSNGASIALIHAGSGTRPVRGVVAMAPHVFVEDITLRSIAEAKTTFHSSDLADRLGRYHDDVASAFLGWSDVWLHREFRCWNIEEYLAGIAVPVLVIQGEDDEYGTVAQVEAIARQVSGPVETVMLPDCTHSPHRVQKHATIEAISGFVARMRKPD